MNAAVIVAAGEGARMGEGVPKAFRPLHGKPLLIYSVEAFSAVDGIEQIVVVVPEGMTDYADSEVLEGLETRSRFSVTVGGASRQESVLNGLESLAGETRLVAVHDAARPLIRPGYITGLLGACDAGCDGVVPALEIVDTVKLSLDKSTVAETVDRQGLYRAQTPQIFQYNKLLAAHKQAREQGLRASDDSQIMEKYGAKVKLYPGEQRNIKVTFADDIALAEALLREGSK